MNKLISWVLGLFKKPQEEITAWPFPTVSEDFEPRPKPEPKKKPAVKKATTRTKKPAVAAKTVRTKKAK